MPYSDLRNIIISGCLSSLIGLALGTQTILNVMIAMQFRLIVGLILWMCHNHMIGIMISGPIASALARLTLSVYIGKAALPMVAISSAWHDFYCYYGTSICESIP